MDKLLAFLNSLPPAQQIAFAKSCGTSLGYLRKAISVRQKLGAELCVAIEHETGRSITRKDLHPDDWHLIWPELQKGRAA